MDKKKKKNKELAGRGLLGLVFSWSLKNVLNKHLYQGKVEKIPKTFTSPDKYMKSFTVPLVEETHADLYSSMTTMSRPPVCEVSRVKKSKGFSFPDNLFYNLTLKPTQCNDKGKAYEPESGDLIALTDVFPRSVEDLKRHGRPYLLAYVQGRSEKDADTVMTFSSKPIGYRPTPFYERNAIQLFAVYLINMTTNIRIYRALNSELKGDNMNVIKQVLQPNNNNGEKCAACNLKVMCNDEYSHIRSLVESSGSNESQESAIMSGLSLGVCGDQNSVNLIWGPPGTGKTKTTAQLLFCLLKMKCRTLTCAPTNVAVLTVTERLLNKVIESLECDSYGLGDIVLFGNGERMKVDDRYNLCDVFLDYRADALEKCFSPFSGYRHNLQGMIGLLEDPKEQYNSYMKQQEDNKDDEVHGNAETSNDQDRSKKKIWKKKIWKKKIAEALKGNKNKEIPKKEKPKVKLLTYNEFVFKRFRYIWERLRYCMVNLYTHMPTSFISIKVAKKMVAAIELLSSLEAKLRRATSSNEQTNFPRSKECLGLLRTLPRSFVVPNFKDSYAIKRFCLSNACLIFCTASSSAKLHTKGMTPVKLLVIDEAAQLKECESMIPLQLSGLRHAILIGDENQLPAMVQSKISAEAEFGRSLFQRLVQLGHKKHLLDVQYRMHPSISLFPNREFYNGEILDSTAVRSVSYEKKFLGGNMYGTFSFINIANGKEQYDGGYSAKNMIEVAVIAEILASLYKEFVRTGKKISIGVISPYNAQVYAIQEKVGDSYAHSGDDFSVNVRSVDGFQGSEEDVIIISTVRNNVNGQVGFMSNHQRTNVALTRAKYCLWVLGSGATLKNSNTIWQKLVVGAETRGCYFEAEKDDGLAKVISDSMFDLQNLDTVFRMDSPLFRNSKWKICFSTEFWKSIEKMKNVEIRKQMLSLLEKLASGWRQLQKERTFVVLEGTSSQLLEQYEINSLLSMIWSVDIQKEDDHYIQIVKVWDVLPLEDIPKLADRLDRDFETYTVNKMNRCKVKSVEGNLVVPMKWHEDLGEMLKSDITQSLTKPFASPSLRDKSEGSSSSPRNYHTRSRGRGGAGVQNSQTQRW